MTHKLDSHGKINNDQLFRLVNEAFETGGFTVVKYGKRLKRYLVDITGFKIPLSAFNVAAVKAIELIANLHPTAESWGVWIDKDDTVFLDVHYSTDNFEDAYTETVKNGGRAFYDTELNKVARVVQTRSTPNVDLLFSANTPPYLN